MLFEFVEKQNLVHQLDPRTKLAIAITFTFLSFILHDPKSLGILLIIIVLYGALAQLYPWHYRKIIFVLIPFTIGITLIQVLAVSSSGATSFINILGLKVPLLGFLRGLVISLRTMVLAISFGLFMMMTHPTDLTHAAVKMGLPFKYAYMTGFSLRFIPLFQEDFRKIREAQTSRGVNENFLGPIGIIASMPALLVPLMMLSLRHSQMLAVALEMRGLSTATTFGRTYLQDVNLRRIDWVILIGMVALLVVTVILQIVAGWVY